MYTQKRHFLRVQIIFLGHIPKRDDLAKVLLQKNLLNSKWSPMPRESWNAFSLFRYLEKFATIEIWLLRATCKKAERLG